MAAAWEHEARGPGGKWIELYHGTTSEKAASIKASGMTASSYSHYNNVLTARKDEAGYFAGAHGAVVTVRIPASKVSEYAEGNPQGLVSLRKPLPLSMIHKVDHMDPRDAGLARPTQQALELSAQTARLASTPAPAGKPGGPGLYRVKGMQLPPYFQNVRNALIRSGHPPAEAYQITWGAIRRWARGGGKAHPEVVAAARAALAALAADSAHAHAHANPDREAITLARVAPGGGGTTSSTAAPAAVKGPTGAQVNAATGATGPRAKAPGGSKSTAGGGGGSGFDAKHPRIGAGNTGGGRFAAKGSGTTSSSGTAAAGKPAAKKPAAAKAPAKKAAAGKAAPPKMNATPKPGPAKPKTPPKAKPKAPAKPKPPAGSRAAKLAQKTQLQTQAKNDRAKARAIFTQIAQLTAAIHTAVKAAAASKASTTATKTAATAAKTAAATTAAAAKTAATAATTTAKTTASTTAKTTSSVPAMRAKRAGLRVQAHTLVTRANALDKQASAIHLTNAGPAAALELAGVPFREELARRVPAGKPGGGRFTEPGDQLTRYATPDQTAVAVNRLAPDQRAVCRATVMPPPGYEWGGGDRLIPAGQPDAALARSEPAIELVGPKGFIHGWIRPGGPAPPAPTAKKPATVGQVAKAHAHSTAYTDAKFTELQSEISALHKQMADMEDSKEAQDAKIKIASHLGVAAAGGILSYALTKAGVPDIVGVATGFMSVGTQEAIDFVKRL